MVLDDVRRQGVAGALARAGRIDGRALARKAAWTVAFCAAAALGRVAFAGIASVQPLTAVAIMAGVLLGRRCGFAVGAGAAFASNMVLGQGAWSLWQMAAWGLAGYLAGVLFAGAKGVRGVKRTVPLTPLVRVLLVSAYGFAASLLFGFIMNTWVVAMFGGALSAQAVVGVYAAGLPFDLAHAASTVAFLAPLAGLWQWRAHANENSAKVK